MVNFSHNSMTNVMTDFPIVNFPDSLHMVFLFHSGYVMLGFVRDMIFCSEYLFWFQSCWKQGYSSRKL